MTPEEELKLMYDQINILQEEIKSLKEKNKQLKKKLKEKPFCYLRDRKLGDCTKGSHQHCNEVEPCQMTSARTIP